MNAVLDKAITKHLRFTFTLTILIVKKTPTLFP